MAYRNPNAAPASRLPLERRGAVVGRFCSACFEIYSPLQPRHTGKPIYGKDHVSAPCAHQGDDFTPGASWWEPAVVVLPSASVPPAPPAAGG